MRSWHAVRAVTRWEFNRYIKWKQQLVSVIITFVVFGAIMILPQIEDEDDDVREIAVIGANVLPLDSVPAEQFRFTAHEPSEEVQLRQRVKDGELAGLVILRDPNGGELVLRRRARWSSDLRNVLTSARQLHMITRTGLSPASLNQILAPVDLQVNYAETAAGQNRGERITIIIVLSLMLMTVFIGMSYIFTSVTGEKQIRVTEQVVSAIPPQAWIDGKMLGLLLVSLIGTFLQVLAFAADYLLVRALFDIGPLPLPDTLGEPLTVALIVLFAILGLFFWFAYMGAIAATIDDPQHSARNAFIFVPIFATIMAYMVVPNPDSVVSRVLSFFPATAPAAMPARLLVSDVALLEVSLSLVLLIASIALLRAAAGRIFQVAMLMYGKEPSWSELRRWMFARQT